nr:E3 SUMO-protein ligase ZBED1-like [Drosophila takahashii]
MDTATRCNRGILGINVQYYDGRRICIKTLGLIELHKRHTAVNLCDEVESILMDFNISKTQIFCVTTDNGKNMLKTVDLLNKEVDNERSDHEEDIDEEGLLKDIKVYSIESVKCAAHTLQLSVKDFLQNLGCHEVVDKARKVVKTLRRPVYRLITIAKGLPQPEVDVATCWNSTYTMLKKLLLFEQFCEQEKDIPLNLDSSDWESMKGVVDVLQPVYAATKKLQSEQLFMGDFYKMWLELKLSIKAMSTPNSILLEDCLQKREATLLENRAVLSADNDENVPREEPSTSSTSSSNSETLLNEFLNSIEVDSNDENSDDEMDADLKIACSEIDNYNPKPIDLGADIMVYWEEKKFVYPNLYLLAMVVHCVPATQLHMNSDVTNDIESTEEDEDGEINFFDLDSVYLEAEPEEE